jgi:hypothetical protein
MAVLELLLGGGRFVKGKVAAMKGRTLPSSMRRPIVASSAALGVAMKPAARTACCAAFSRGGGPSVDTRIPPRGARRFSRRDGEPSGVAYVAGERADDGLEGFVDVAADHGDDRHDDERNEGGDQAEVNDAGAAGVAKQALEK